MRMFVNGDPDAPKLPRCFAKKLRASQITSVEPLLGGNGDQVELLRLAGGGNRGVSREFVDTYDPAPGDYYVVQNGEEFCWSAKVFEAQYEIEPQPHDGAGLLSSVSALREPQPEFVTVGEHTFRAAQVERWEYKRGWMGQPSVTLVRLGGGVADLLEIQGDHRETLRKALVGGE